MRIGVLGTGVMGQQHLAAARSLADVEMVTRAHAPFDAIDPPDRLALRDAMLRDRSIDAIDICLPTTAHLPTALAALAAGKHVLCEKPLALNNLDCDRILAAAQSTRATFMVAHVVRFFPTYRYLAQAIRGGNLGEVRRARFIRMSGYPKWAGWLTDPSQSGGAILDLLVHDFDQVIALFGSPSKIEADRIESADTVRAVLGCGGVEVLVEGGWFADERAFSMGFEVVFEGGRLLYADQQLTLHRGNLQCEAIVLPDADGYAEQLRYFVQCCTLSQAPLECPPEQSAAAVALALAVRDKIN